MGWLFSGRWQDKASLVKHLTDENGLPTLAKSVRGNTLWAVHEGTMKDGTKIRFIGCYLMASDRKNCGGWGYKDMDESMGPYNYDCPLKFLDMAPVANEKWREGVRAFHTKAASKRSVLKGLAVGCKVRLVDSCTIMGEKVTELLTITSVKPLRGQMGFMPVNIKPRHIAEVVPA